MLPKENRLKKRKDFERIFKKGKAIIDKFLFLKFFKNNLKNSRFGFIVSLKVSKKSTTRNRIKRQLKAIIKENLSDIKLGLDVIIVAGTEIINKRYQEIRKELERLLKKASLYK